MLSEHEAREILRANHIERGLDDDRSCVEIVATRPELTEVTQVAPVEEVVMPDSALRRYIETIPYKERRAFFAR